MTEPMPCEWNKGLRLSCGVGQPRTLRTDLPVMIGVIEGEAALLIAHLGSVLRTVLSGSDAPCATAGHRIQICRSVWSMVCRVPKVGSKEEER